MALLTPLLLALLPLTGAASLPARGAPHATQVSIPMVQGAHGPIFNLTYGTPPQTITMLSDWTWQSTWFYTPFCRGSYSPANCVLPGQNAFAYESSSTYAPTKDSIQTFDGTDYTPGLPFTVSFGTDVMCLPNSEGRPLCSKGIEGQISDLEFEFPTVQDVGGIFGLAPVLAGYNSTYFPAPWQYMKDGLLKPVVGWHMCAYLKDESTCAGKDYLTIMGGTETDLYNQKDMQYHPIVVTDCVNVGNLGLNPVRDNYWSATWTNLFIGNTPISLSANSTGQHVPANSSCPTIDPVAIFDEGGQGHGAPIPIAAYPALTRQLGATEINATSALPLNEGTQGLWSVPCAKVASFPNFIYELSNKQNITVTPDMYIDRKTKPGTCLLNVRIWDRSVDGAQTFFGQVVLGRTYLKYEFDNLRTGIAPLKKHLYR